MNAPQPKGEVPMNSEDLDAIMAELEAETAGAIPTVQVAPPAVVAQAPAATPAPAPIEVVQTRTADETLANLGTMAAKAPAVIAPEDRPDAGVHTATGIPEYTEGMKPIEPLPWEDHSPSDAPPLVTEGPLAAAAARRAAARAAAIAGATPLDLAFGKVERLASTTPTPTTLPPAAARQDTTIIAATPAPTPAPPPAATRPPLTVVPPAQPPAATPVAAPAANLPQQTRGGIKPLDHFGIDGTTFRRETVVTDTNLDNCMMEQSALRAYWSEIAAHAEAQATRAKAEYELGEAKLFDYHRKLLAAAGEKTTEKVIDAAVKTDARWFKLKERQIQAESIAAVAKGFVKSLEDRRDMIIQMGADRREGMKGQVRTMQTVR